MILQVAKTSGKIKRTRGGKFPIKKKKLDLFRFFGCNRL